MRAALTTPRPLPGRLLPALGAALVLAVALPVFVLLDWPLAGWALGAILWLALAAVNVLLARAQKQTASVATSAVQAFGLFFKAIAVLVVLLAAAAANPDVALAAAIVFALAYTFELGLSLATYFGAAR